MKGLLFCCYGHPEYVDECFAPFLTLKEKLNFKIAVVSGQFKEYAENRVPDVDFETQKKLKQLKQDNKIDFLYLQNDYAVQNEPKFETEAEIRNYGLQYLLSQEVESVMLVDLDEFYTEKEIVDIFDYISKNNLYAWFSINFKNIVFNGTKYIDGFCPPRIFRAEVAGYKLKQIYWDNDCLYLDGSGRETTYKLLGNKQTPKTVAHVIHKTWLDSDGNKKVNYQLKHFGHCGYKWDYEQNKLEFDLEFHKKNNIPITELKSL